MKKLIIITIFFILFFTAFIKAEEEVSLSIDEAIAIALRDNSDILLKAQDVEKAKAEINEAKAPLYPTFTITSTGSRNRGYYTKDFAYLTSQATLKQYLYKGGETINSIKYNEYLVGVNEALLDKAKLETILNVKKAFWTLLLAENFAKVNKVILKNTQNHLYFVEARYRNGEASDSDILKIKASLDSVTEAYETSLNQIASSQILLNNYLNLDKDVKIVPNAELGYRKEDIVYEEALLEALRTRPEIRQYEAQEKADEHNIEVAKADNRPNIYASWDYYSRSHAAAGTSKNWGDYNIMAITFSWPMFDGGATKAKIEQAVVDLKETQILKEKIPKDIRLELKNAYLSLKNAIAKINATESDLKVYRDNLLTLKERFKDGMASVLDMEDAILKYLVSRFNKMQAIYDYIIAKSSFEKAIGGV